MMMVGTIENFVSLIKYSTALILFVYSLNVFMSLTKLLVIINNFLFTKLQVFD